MKQARNIRPIRPGVNNAARILQRAEYLVESRSHITEYNVFLPQIVLQGVHQLMSLQQKAGLRRQHIKHFSTMAKMAEVYKCDVQFTKF